MARIQIGKVSALARYPVKSMLGEALDELEIGDRGAIGDRAYALRELATRLIVSAKKFPRLYEFRATYDSPPAVGKSARITIELPGGRKIHANDADASEAISAALGHRVALESSSGARGEKAGIDPSSVFADVPVEKVIPGLTAATMPDHFALEKNSFFDTAVMHVIASGTLRHMAKLAAPGSNFDPRRFRPTIFVDSVARDDAFIEDEWIGGTLEVGDALKIVAMQPALRCVMTTHPQEDLARDYAILRTAAQHHRANVGVFASIGAPGRVRVGDPVYLDK
ncbi:MAG TPA: MOSC N-terminal beta barrel domain-containing protein [Candidatus Acidoferrales bacterium]|nr:MOSC N-terminal beta barrel domain-containing protein [Candidatus Acidoferrales bacterium]